MEEKHKREGGEQVQAECKSMFSRGCKAGRKTNDKSVRDVGNKQNQSLAEIRRAGMRYQGDELDMNIVVDLWSMSVTGGQWNRKSRLQGRETSGTINQCEAAPWLRFPFTCCFYPYLFCCQPCFFLWRGMKRQFPLGR